MRARVPPSTMTSDFPAPSPRPPFLYPLMSSLRARPLGENNASTKRRKVDEQNAARLSESRQIAKQEPVQDLLIKSPWRVTQSTDLLGEGRRIEFDGRLEEDKRVLISEAATMNDSLRSCYWP